MTNEEAIYELKLDKRLYETETVYSGDGTPDGDLMLALDMAISALRAQQWISVEDRLPDMCGCKCLVVGTNRFGQVDVFTAFTGYMERGKLEFHSCEPTHEIPAWTVTHWRELPQPPEKKGK